MAGEVADTGRVRTAATLSIVAAGGALAAGYALGGRLAASVLGAAVAIGWLLLRRRRGAWVGNAGLVACAAAAAAGTMLDVGSAWMLLCLVAALTAWDLDAFSRWLQDCPSSAGAQALQRRHLQRLLAVDVLGLGLGLVALRLHLRLRLGILLLLGLILAVGLSRIVRRLRRPPE